MSRKNRAINTLPSSDSKFWKEAEVKKIKLEDSPRCNHYFERVSGIRAECKKCRVGYFLTPDIQVKKGHIYIEGELVI